MNRMMSTNASTPAEYVAPLRGWRKKCVTALPVHRTRERKVDRDDQVG